jgi:hypothetical protein
MSRLAVSGLAAAVSCVLAGRVAAQDITELTIPEQAGVERRNEPVRMGIPLAKGVVSDVAELTLKDGGKTVPAQFSEVMRWPEDNSLRWVHVVFQTSVKAGSIGKVTLARGNKAAASPMDVAETGGAVTVRNGILKLVFKGNDLIDSASYDPAGRFAPGTEVIKTHADGITAVINGKKFKASSDSRASIVERGSETVVVKVSGALTDGTDAPFEYVCYAHVFRGSPVVRLEVAYTCVQGKDAPDFVTLNDLSLVLPTTLAGGSASVGTEKSVLSGKSVSIMAVSSSLSELKVDGRAAGTAAGKSAKPKTIGWVALSSGKSGLAVGVRWFWQMFPKAMEASADGKLRAGLYAAEAGGPLDVYMGQGRTHYVTLRFGPQADAETAAFFAGTQMPLRALCSPKYYCEETEGFGRVAQADPAIYPADVAEKEKKYNDCLLGSVQYIEKKIDGHSYNGVTMDSYGYNEWGDVFHHANEAGNTNKWNILWESNYYDYPWACGIQFARTGETLYLDILDRHGLHLADVFMCKYSPVKNLRGACRYSPPANHVGLDTDWNAPKPYVSVEFNHHKAQSILARYYLLGDLRARDDFMLALNNAMTNPEASWRQCRGPGAKLATLYSGYILTRDPACIEKMKECMAPAIKMKDNPKGFSRQGSSGYFMMGIATEGMYYHWLLTGDADTFETMKSITDFQIGEARNSSVANSACATALMYRQLGDDKYKAGALSFLKDSRENRPKGFGSSWRNAGYAWYYLSDLAARKK